MFQNTSSVYFASLVSTVTLLFKMYYWLFKDTQEALAAVKHGDTRQEASQLYTKQAQGYRQCHHQSERHTGAQSVCYDHSFPHISWMHVWCVSPDDSHLVSSFLYSSSVYSRGRQARTLFSCRQTTLSWMVCLKRENWLNTLMEWEFTGDEDVDVGKCLAIANSL